MKARILIAAAVLAASVWQLYAATITVTSIADGGPGTLRDALANAADGDTIDASSVTGTILLTTGELLVTNSVDIIGPGPDLLVINAVRSRINGGFSSSRRALHIGSNAVVSISSLTITNGAILGNGGGIWNDHATLIVSNIVLSGNSANTDANGGGIYNDHANLTVKACTLHGNYAYNGGGAIYNDASGGTATIQIAKSILSGNRAGGNGGAVDNNVSAGGDAPVQIVDSTLSGNSAYLGGSVHNVGGSGGNASLRIMNCTISSNLAYGYGGGIETVGYGGTAAVEIVNSTFTVNATGGYGGGIDNYGGNGGLASVSVANSTANGNSAIRGGAINNENATLQIVNSTFGDNSATNGGSIYNTSTANLEIGSTILKAGASGGTITNDLGTITSLGYNLSSDDGGGFLTATGDQTNTDPMLGPLQDNGGPTFTCAVLPGSPAINAGDPNFTPPPDFDQRGPGFPRVAYGRIDIGAFEVQTLPDSDGDGVPDMFDQCPNTARGPVVDSNGCSIAQLVPCAGPVTGGTWKSHGQYVATVVQEATNFLKAGLITRRQWAQIVTQTAWSRCGWNRRWDWDGDRDWSRAWDCDRDRDWGRDRR